MKGDKLFENLIIGSIKTANIILTGMDMLGGAIIDSFKFLIEDNNENKSYNIESTNSEEELRNKWEREVFYMSDEKIEEELRRNLIYNYSIEYDGRRKCQEVLVNDLVKNNKRPY